MIIPALPQTLAEDILHRSRCHVRVGAVLADKRGIFAWGWNHDKGGYGEHAEIHCFNRANPKRTTGATLYVAGERMPNHNIVESKPCSVCEGWAKRYGVARCFYRAKSGEWKRAW